MDSFIPSVYSEQRCSGLRHRRGFDYLRCETYCSKRGMSRTTRLPVPWEPDCLAQQVQILTDIAGEDCEAAPDTAKELLAGARYHLQFLKHHLQHALFPSEVRSENPKAAFAADLSHQYLSVVVASSTPGNVPTKKEGGAALQDCSVTQAGGKPVMSQSALHGFHVYEGLQLIAEKESGEFRLGYTFMNEKISKLVDGIIRLRFAVHLLKASFLIRRLENINHGDAEDLEEEFDHIVHESLPLRRAQAEMAVAKALWHFVDVNRHEMTAALENNRDSFFYVRVEAQGGNRESIGQGPNGVGQSTIQIFGQHAKLPDTPARVVLNPDAPPRMHSLAGPFSKSPFYSLLNNAAVHHGNMGHQHLAGEMAQPHGSDMLMCTAEIDEDGQLQGPFIAETNFSNIGFVYDGQILFPKTNSAAYGITQHVIREALSSAYDFETELEGVFNFEYAPLSMQRFTSGLRDGKVTGAFTMGTMAGVRPVSTIYFDETLSTGSVKCYPMNHDSLALRTILDLYKKAYRDSISWK